MSAEKKAKNWKITDEKVKQNKTHQQKKKKKMTMNKKIIQRIRKTFIQLMNDEQIK